MRNDLFRSREMPSRHGAPATRGLRWPDLSPTLDSHLSGIGCGYFESQKKPGPPAWLNRCTMLLVSDRRRLRPAKPALPDLLEPDRLTIPKLSGWGRTVAPAARH